MKRARLATGLNQTELAKKAGFKHQSAIGNIESGMRDGSKNIAALAMALGVDPFWLQTGKGEMKPAISSLAMDVAKALSSLPEEEQKRLAPIIAAAIGRSITDAEVEQKMPITRPRKKAKNELE